MPLGQLGFAPLRHLAHRLEHGLATRVFLEQVHAVGQWIGFHATRHFVDQRFNRELGVARAHRTPEAGINAALFDHELHAVVRDVVGDFDALHHRRILAARGLEGRWHHA